MQLCTDSYFEIAVYFSKFGKLHVFRHVIDIIVDFQSFLSLHLGLLNFLHELIWP